MEPKKKVATSPTRHKLGQICTSKKARITSRYEHLGTQITIEAEGTTYKLLIEVMERMVTEIKLQHQTEEVKL